MRPVHSMITRALLAAAMTTVLSWTMLSSSPAMADSTPGSMGGETAQIDLHWHTDYMKARNVADMQEKMLLIFFHKGESNESLTKFDHEVLSKHSIREQLSNNFVLLRQNLDATTHFSSEPTTDAVVLDHSAFNELKGSPGLAIVDLKNVGADHYHHVVSAFPFEQGQHYDERRVDVILNLPAGTLTQRTLIYAVRIHPESPQSTNGEIHPALLKSATWHSQHMADIHVQGHHRWESRFHALAGQIPAGLTPSEVAAESWPGETLVEAAIECVDSWRHSSGHWRGVVGDHPIYGYDMKLGSNGIWYATGIFGTR